jgi:hypothetical protein
LNTIKGVVGKKWLVKGLTKEIVDKKYFSHAGTTKVKRNNEWTK